MEEQFYKMCAANNVIGTIKSNVLLLACYEIGTRFTISRNDVHASIEVTYEDLQYGGEKVLERIFPELYRRLCETERMKRGKTFD